MCPLPPVSWRHACGMPACQLACTELSSLRQPPTCFLPQRLSVPPPLPIPPCAVDKFGRRFLFLEGGIQMIAGLVTTGAILAVEFKSYTASTLPSGVAVGLLVVICIYVAAFAWSWGPLGWLVSEYRLGQTQLSGMQCAMHGLEWAAAGGRCHHLVPPHPHTHPASLRPHSPTIHGELAHAGALRDPDSGDPPRRHVLRRLHQLVSVVWQTNAVWRAVSPAEVCASAERAPSLTALTPWPLLPALLLPPQPLLLRHWPVLPVDDVQHGVWRLLLVSDVSGLSGGGWGA